MSHNRLYYNGVTLEQKANSVELTPHFFHDLWGDGVSRCPICHAPSEWNDKRVVALLPAQDLDFNGQSKGDRTFRGAYSGDNANPGWQLTDDLKVGGPGDILPPAAPKNLRIIKIP